MILEKHGKLHPRPNPIPNVLWCRVSSRHRYVCESTKNNAELRAVLNTLPTTAAKRSALGNRYNHCTIDELYGTLYGALKVHMYDALILLTLEYI